MAVEQQRSQRISRELTARADRVMPGASIGSYVASEQRSFVASRGVGSTIFDADGNPYIDYVLGSGPLILGHAHPAIVDAVKAQAELGTHFYAVNEPIIELAEIMVEAIPCAEKVKFSSTGSEANILAMRLARAATGRDKVLKFEGGYHGHSDYTVVGYAPRRLNEVVYPHAPADSAGVPRDVAAQTLVAPYNDAETTAAIIEDHRHELSAVIVEPYQRIIPPQPGFLEALREITRATGMLLIFDEVVTGFRLAWGGAQEHYGVVPDLAVYGKTIGGGLAISAVAGRADLLDLADPRRREQDERYTFFGGTFSGNPLAAVAGVATLRELAKPGTYARFKATCDAIGQGLQAALTETGVPGQVLWANGIVTLLFTDEPVIDYRSAQRVNREHARRWHDGLLERGLLVNPTQQKWYVSVVHTADDVAATLAAARDILREIARG